MTLTHTAEADLAEIWAFIAEDSDKAADRFIDAIYDHAKGLLIHPETGSDRSEFAPELRASFFRRYAIYYTFDARQIVIVRVAHGARDQAALFPT